MKNFAVLSGNCVVNIIVADSLENAEIATNANCVEFFDQDYVSIGFNYVNGNFIPSIKTDETLAE
jgi:hypothetical protein